MTALRGALLAATFPALVLGGCSAFLDFDALRAGRADGGADLAGPGGWARTPPTPLLFPAAEPDGASAPAIAAAGGAYLVAMTGGPLSKMYLGLFDPTSSTPFTFVDSQSCTGLPCALSAPRIGASAKAWVVSTRRTGGFENSFYYDAPSHALVSPGITSCTTSHVISGNDVAVSPTDYVTVAGCSDGFELSGAQHARTTYDLRVAQAAGSPQTAWLAFVELTGLWITSFPVDAPDPNGPEAQLGDTTHHHLGLALAPDGTRGLLGSVDSMMGLQLVAFAPGPTPAPAPVALAELGAVTATSTAAISIAAVGGGFLVAYESAGKVYGLPVSLDGTAQPAFVIAEGAARPSVAAGAKGGVGVVWIDAATNTLQGATLTPR